MRAAILTAVIVPLLLVSTADAQREPRLIIESLNVHTAGQAGHGFYDTKEHMLYFFGGRGSDHDIWQIDPDTLAKSRIWDISPVNGYTSGDWSGHVYWFAGGVTRGHEGEPTNLIHRYDVENQAVTVGAEMPETLFDGVGVWHEHDGKLYILGGYWGGEGLDGTGGAYRAYAYTYMPETGVLTKLPDLPRRGDNATAVYDPVRKVVYFIGGHFNDEFYDDIIEVRSDGSSEVVATLPAPVDIGGAYYYQGHVYIFGGRDYDGESDRIYRFDTFSGSVETLPERLPQAQHIYASARSGDAYYILSPHPTVIQFR